MMRAIMNVRKTIAEGAADTPVLRLVALLERVASRHEPFALQGLVEDTGLPKPTLHRMLQQLEGAGLLRRESDGRRYGTGVRLRQLAENLLLNDTLHGARHAVLRQLVEEVGESCNLTALSGSDVIYLDRVETAAPLRFYLHPGSRVPVHCSASGKMFLAQMSPLQRKRLLAHAPLQKLHRVHHHGAVKTRERDRAGQAQRLCAGQRRVPARPGVPGGARADIEGRCALACQPLRGAAGTGHAAERREGLEVVAGAATCGAGFQPHRRGTCQGRQDARRASR